MIEAIFLDFDWTVYSHRTKKIPDSAFEAILKAQKNNIKIFLSTGRDMEEIKTFDCRGLKFDGYILDNGQVLLDKDLNIIEANYIEGKSKEKILSIFNGKEYSIVLRSLNDAFVNFVNEYSLKSFHDVNTELPPVKKYEGEDIVVATIAIKNEEEKIKLSEILSDLNVTWWHDSSCDVVCKGNDKVVGVHKMLKHFNINGSFMAIGDGDNDTEMIKDASIGVAMGNSIDKVKEIANYTTDDIDANGLANAFRKYKVI